MNRYVAAVFLLIIISTVLPVAANDAARKPIVDQEVLPVVPDSFTDLWDTSDLVARVRIESSHVRGVGKAPLVVTEHHATVLRVFKGVAERGQALSFAQSAGDLELPDRIIHVTGAGPLAEHFEYVVFLREWPAAGAYILTGDRAGAFRIVHGVVQPQGGGAVAEEHRNLAERRFLDELEQAASRPLTAATMNSSVAADRHR